jgi:hypothetical protein
MPNPHNTRMSLFGFRHQKPPAIGTEIVTERCLTCAHYKPMAAPFGSEPIENCGNIRTGTCLLIGGWTHEWNACNKYRGD